MFKSRKETEVKTKFKRKFDKNVSNALNGYYNGKDGADTKPYKYDYFFTVRALKSMPYYFYI